MMPAHRVKLMNGQTVTKNVGNAQPKVVVHLLSIGMTHDEWSAGVALTDPHTVMTKEN